MATVTPRRLKHLNQMVTACIKSSGMFGNGASIQEVSHSVPLISCKATSFGINCKRLMTNRMPLKAALSYATTPIAIVIGLLLEMAIPGCQQAIIWVFDAHEQSEKPPILFAEMKRIGGFE